MSCVDEALDFAARFLIQIGRDLRKLIDAAMDVGVLSAVVARDRVDDALRFLRAGAVVEIDERLAVEFLFEDRELRADGVQVIAAHASEWSNDGVGEDGIHRNGIVARVFNPCLKAQVTHTGTG